MEEENKRIENIIRDVGKASAFYQRKMEEAREAYNSLTGEQKTLIDNEVIQKLEYAVKYYEQFEIDRMADTFEKTDKAVIAETGREKAAVDLLHKSDSELVYEIASAQPEGKIDIAEDTESKTIENVQTNS